MGQFCKRCGKGRAKVRNKAAGQGPCSRDSNLLAQNRAHCELESVHGSRHAQAAGARKMVFQLCVDGVRVGIECNGARRLATGRPVG